MVDIDALSFLAPRGVQMVPLFSVAVSRENR